MVEGLSLAALLEARIKRQLNPRERELADQALVAVLGKGAVDTLYEWRSEDLKIRGSVVLRNRYKVADGRTCAVVHHVHWFADTTIRGSVTVCRREGGPWRPRETR